MSPGVGPGKVRARRGRDPAPVRPELVEGPLEGEVDPSQCPSLPTLRVQSLPQALPSRSDPACHLPLSPHPAHPLPYPHVHPHAPPTMDGRIRFRPFANRISCLETPLSATDSKSQNESLPYLRPHSFSQPPPGGLGAACIDRTRRGNPCGCPPAKRGGTGGCGPMPAGCFPPPFSRPISLSATPRTLFRAPPSAGFVPICTPPLKPRDRDTTPSCTPTQTDTQSTQFQAAPICAASQPSSCAATPKHEPPKKTRTTIPINSNPG